MKWILLKVIITYLMRTKVKKNQNGDQNLKILFFNYFKEEL